MRRLFPWKEDERYAASGARHHPTVAERFGLDSVSLLGEVGPYRPKALIFDPQWGAACQARHKACLPADFEVRWSAVTPSKPD